MPPDIADAEKAIANTYLSAGVERTQIERLIIKLTLRLRIPGLQHLKAAVKPKAIDLIGCHTAANTVAGLEDAEADAGLL